MKNKISALLLSVLTVASLAGCGGADQEAGVKAAADYIKSMYQDASTTTTGDLKRVSKYVEGEDTYNVVWTVDVTTDGMDKVVTVGENDGVYTKILIDTFGASADTLYTLTATITSPNGKFTETLTYNYKVPKFIFTSFADFTAAAVGDSVNVKGNVVMKTKWGSTSNIWVQDGTNGGYYGYKVSTPDQAEYDKIKIGSEVVISGAKDVYSDTIEIKDATVKLYSDVITQAPYVDATAAFTNASSNKDHATLDKYQNMRIQLNDVEIAGMTENSNGDYYNFKLGNNTYYLRASTSYGLTDANVTSMFANWKQGFKANVRGVAQLYNSAFYFQPTDVQDVVYTKTSLTDAEKVESAITFAKGLFEEVYYEAAQVTLPANATDELYNDVALTWALADDSDTEYFAIADGKLNVTIPTTAGTTATGKVNVTATVGEVNVTETISVKVEMIPETISIAKFLEEGAKEELNKDNSYTGSNVYYLKGIITAVNSTSRAGAFILTDSTGSVFSYNSANVKLGDEVIIETNYKENYSFPQANTTKLVKTVSTGNDVATASGTATTVTSAEVMAALTASDASTTSIYNAFGGKFVAVECCVYKDGSYYNATCVDMTAAGASATKDIQLYCNETLKETIGSFENKKVVVYGYLRGVNTSSKNITIQVQSIVEAA